MAEASFPSVHTTGAVHHFVRGEYGGNPGSIFYLGTAEVTPQVLRRKFGQDVFNDRAGKTLPFQRTRDGEDATISVLLTFFSKDAHSEILSMGAQLGRMGPAGSFVGTEGRFSRGGLIFGVETFELWQVFEFGPGMAPADVQTPGLEIGWYWPQVELLEHNMEAAGTQAEKLLLVFHAQPMLIVQQSDTSVNAAANERGWKLYSNNPADFPAGVLVPQ